MTEDQLQAACYRWFHNNFPSHRGLLFSVPNGGTRNPIEAMKLKATGLLPGVPDMVLISPGPVGIEFKTATGTLSPAQVKVHAAWKAAGTAVHVIRSEQEFQALIFGLITVS